MFQNQMAKFNSAKPKLLFHQPNTFPTDAALLLSLTLHRLYFLFFSLFTLYIKAEIVPEGNASLPLLTLPGGFPRTLGMLVAASWLAGWCAVQLGLGRPSTEAPGCWPVLLSSAGPPADDATFALEQVIHLGVKGITLGGWWWYIFLEYFRSFLQNFV